MHPSLQSVPPQAPERGSDQVAALPTLRDVWQDLDVAIHTASSVQASIALRIDERVPSAIRQRLAGAVELVRDAGQMLKQWTEVLVKEPAVTTPGASPAAPAAHEPPSRQHHVNPGTIGIFGKGRALCAEIPRWRYWGADFLPVSMLEVTSSARAGPLQVT